MTSRAHRLHLPVREVFDIPVAALTLAEVLELVDQAVRTREKLHIGVVNAAKVVNMRRDPALRHDVLSSDVILADGAPVVWTSRLLGRTLPERVTGIDLMLGILERGRERRYRIYCLGATPAVLGVVLARIAADFSGVQLAGHHHGYFTPEEEPAVIEDIARARADILLVAMTSPRKEQFLARWGDRVHVPVLHGVGGSFDVLAGKVRRAPLAWRRLGLEWLYRVKQEPRRMWRRYLVTNTLFCGLAARCVLRELRRYARRRPLLTNMR